MFCFTVVTELISVSGFRWEDHLCKAQNTVVRNWEIGGCFIESRFVPQENQPSKRNRVHHNLSWRHNVFRGQLHVNSGVVIVFNSLTCFISFLAYISFWFLSLLHRITKRQNWSKLAFVGKKIHWIEDFLVYAFLHTNQYFVFYIIDTACSFISLRKWK